MTPPEPASAALNLAESTGVPLVDAAVVWSVAGAALAGMIILIWRGVRGIRRVIERVDTFADDWAGVRSRPGVPERPGVMVRLDRIEEQLQSVQHELRPNSGQSLRDAVDRVERTLAADTDSP
ncbi:hypothetical protein [Streptomyces sp. AK08-02]|uniref:hypothetical protein n=1 Tax=Streptomyces sp. AK08-02 TaxID=3028654 RepID=UPI0029A063EA|nr:hypothetical protein [Streptomyces sp. AK08-02]MDX3746708.1 hypothetical protein [Streptomyces sp. AK08-02]